LSETETVVEKKEEVKDSESSADVAESAQKSEAVTETVEEVKTRQANWTRPEARYTRGVLAKYAKTVSSASLGAVTDLE